MKKMKIVLKGDPLAQGRMRRGKWGNLYDPMDKQKKAIRQEMAGYVKQFYINFEKLKHPRLSFVFHMPIPKSIPKKLLPLYQSGLLKHEKKPDADNLIKLYQDCLDGIAFDNDEKVVLGAAIKLYHTEPKTIIILNDTNEMLSPLEVDPLTWIALFGEESGRCSYDQMVSLDDTYTPTNLIHWQFPDKIYPQQTTESSVRLPTVPWILAQAGQVSKQACHLGL